MTGTVEDDGVQHVEHVLTKLEHKGTSFYGITAENDIDFGDNRSSNR